MDNKEIAHKFEEIAKLLELQGENPFKVNAYFNAARTIEALPEDLKHYFEENKLQTLKGIGKSIAEKIEELFRSGTIEMLETLKSETPPGLLEMLRIPGLGPKKILALYKHLHIATVKELEYACLENRLVLLDGFGQKTQEKIQHGITMLALYKDKHLLNEMYPLAHAIVQFLLKNSQLRDAAIAGSLRRYKELVKDIDIVVSTTQPAEIASYCLTCPYSTEIIEQGENICSFYAKGIRVDIKIVKTEQFASALMHFTGSKENNVELRRIAKQRGYKINEYGIFKSEKPESVNSEEEFYAFFDMQYIPPELRENFGEVELAMEHNLPRLVSRDDVLGFLHVHSNWSDGIPSIEDMAKEAQRLGYHYIGIADHSKSAAYAGGLTEKRVAEQIKIIDELNAKLKHFTVLKGIEVDILKDGSIDLDDSILKELDFVIASVHSHFHMTEEEMTKRVLAALNNRYVDMIGHPTGRLLLGREPFKINMDAVIEETKKLGKVLELNANAHRLDIDWRNMHKFRGEDLLVSINPDAHHLDGITDMEYGIGIARKGWCQPANIINTLTAEKLLSFL